ncbi:MAG TPA: 4-(cytidine 5'-diphospho)-2-C-methyl-D-erythritol kinase, partial [candidate division WOR-3 bacterium]|nr:4-(cytidine 5'-diphospho)-2-C-methyl-D-erythritol kinase [candidate division WOR-3 bacterium]
MGILFFKAKAKINLNLHLLPELSDKGYYPVKFLNSQLDIYDRVRIAINDKKKINLSLLCENKAMNSPVFKIEEGENIAYRVAELIKNEYGIKSGIDIEIKKNIPIKAGLGGGSCDAAAVINGMDKLFSLNLSISQKIKLAEKLGMDVCYCVVGGLCLVGGIGNIILPLPYP